MNDGTSRPLPVAFLASGGGTTLQNLIDRQAAGELDLDFRLVVSDRGDAGVLERAERAGLPHRVIPYQPGEAFHQQLESAIVESEAQLALMGGFLRLWRFSSRFRHRVMNIHPSLLPAFGGKGYYGERVHRAVLERGAKLSGCTVHFCDHDYDRGPIIVQKICPVHFEDTVETLRQRVFELECEAYPEAIRLFQEGRLHFEGRRVIITPR